MSGPPWVSALAPNEGASALAIYLVDRYSERKERDPERLRAVAADIGFAKR